MEDRRVTCARLMLGVALVGLSTWGYVLWRRSAAFALRAQLHLTNAEVHAINRESVYRARPGRSPRNPTAADKLKHDSLDLWFAYETRLYRKYRYAACHPWMSVGADSEVKRPFGGN